MNIHFPFIIAALRHGQRQLNPLLNQRPLPASTGKFHTKLLIFTLLPVFCLLLLLLSCGCPSVQAANTKPASTLIRLGVSEYPGYAYKDEEGNISGADVEYAYRLAQYADLDIQIVLIDEAEDYFGALNDHKVDMLFDAIKTPEREQKYLYAEREVGSTPLSVYVSNDDKRFEYGNVEQLKGLRFGSEAGSQVGPIFSAWGKMHGFTPSIIEYPTTEDVDKAMAAKAVDAGLYGTDTKEGFNIIQLFSPTPYYIIFRKDATELKNKIDDAMARILAEDPLYVDRLIKKYTLVSKPALPTFTRAEQAYLNEHPTLKIAVLTRDAPYFSTTSAGQEKGILPEYYSYVAAITGQKLAFQSYSSQAEAIAAVKNKEADVLGIYSAGLISAYANNLRLTRAYGNASTVLLTPVGANKNTIKTIAVKERSLQVIKMGLDADLPAQLVNFNTGAECFSALNSQKTDAMVCGLPTATWLTNQGSGPAYSITPFSKISFELCSAVNSDNKILIAILDKAIYASAYRFDGIVANNTLPEANWHSFIKRIPPLSIAVFAIFMFILALSLILALINLKHRQEEKAAIFAAKAETEQQRIKLEAIAKSTEEKHQFFSTISHDMRTPLNAIIGFAALAQKELISTRAADYLGKIQSSGQLLLELINDTLTLSKIGSGKLQLKLEPVDITNLLAEINIPIQEAAFKKQLTFTADLSKLEPRAILADKLNVTKILMNLLSNAIKYTPEGGHVCYKAWDEPDSDGAPLTVITVQDDGIGIAPDFLDHLYEPFMQEQRQGYQASGTGLGLSIVQKLVQLMNGTITVHSVKDKGTLFTVQLHFPTTSSLEAAPAQQEAENYPALLSGKKVLLCEDNQLNREIATALLQSKGLQVVCAENGQIGVDYFTSSSQGEYACILMDIRMPVLNGYQATAAIRASHHPDAAAIPILAMTADAFEEDVQKCLEASMQGHIAKPINPGKLYATLARFIRT